MRKIPDKIKKVLTDDPFMKNCVACLAEGIITSEKPEWHHPFIYDKKQMTDEIWQIIPLCKKHHAEQKAKDLAEFLGLLRYSIIEHDLYFKKLQEKFPKHPKWIVDYEYKKEDAYYNYEATMLQLVISLAIASFEKHEKKQE